MFVMYYIYGVSVPSLLIESTDSMITIKIITVWQIIFVFRYFRGSLSSHKIFPSKKINAYGVSA